MRILALLLTLAAASAAEAQTSLDQLLQIPTAERLRAWHEMVASRPHMAGTEGDGHVIDQLARSFGEMGCEVDVHEIWPLLSYPVSAEVEVIHPSIKPGAGLLPLKEPTLAEDPYSGDDDLPFGFNAYSGSGEATGEVVYANFGSKQDFERLAELGVDCTGKVVLARYGGNYRGYKAKFAEAAGAAGLLIYLDPGDTGYIKGDVYPQGGWQTDMCIQRGSINTLPYSGDPLTPFVEATEHAERLDPGAIGLPRIPVQPIGWGAVRQILLRMDGPEAPEEWRGGLPLSYRLTGGADLRVRVNVQQERKITRTANVIATVRGALYPDQWVIVGCHHDAWGFGACDPTCGLISLLESARSFSALAAAGHPPARTVIFCAWGAEEFGIIGSSEWVEAHAEELGQKAVAYINLDMASMGPEFGASASPSVRRLIEDAARLVPQARAPDKTVFDDWASRAHREDDPLRPTIGDLGGGSDHVGFVCHLGIPGIALGCGGSMGSSYHTAYDNLHWYRQVVGEDYEPALMIARMTNAIAGKLANDPVLRCDLGATAEFIATELGKGVDERVGELAATGDQTWVRIRDEELPALRARCAAMAPVWESFEAGVVRIGGPEVLLAIGGTVSEGLIRADRPVGGLTAPSRPWFRNELVTADADSGYGSATIPVLRDAIAREDGEAALRAIGDLSFMLDAQAEELRGLTRTLESVGEPGQ